MDINSQIKNQYSKIFTKTDWITFKLMADYYFETAAKILKKDINIKEPYKLMARNIQKRLFIGIGTELLLKSLFLKNEYCINKVKNKKIPNPRKPTKFSTILNQEILTPGDTYSLNILIQNVTHLVESDHENQLGKGLRIAQVFRNKEGHVAALWHNFDPQNYTDVEYSIMEVYKKGFDEDLEFQISFETGEPAKFVRN